MTLFKSSNSLHVSAMILEFRHNGKIARFNKPLHSSIKTKNGILPTIRKTTCNIIKDLYVKMSSHYDNFFALVTKLSRFSCNGKLFENVMPEINIYFNLFIKKYEWNSCCAGTRTRKLINNFSFLSKRYIGRKSQPDYLN